MNGKQSKRLRRHIKNILPNSPETEYTQERKTMQTAKGNVFLGMTTIMVFCRRKFYKQLKRDVKRYKRHGTVPTRPNVVPEGKTENA